MSSEIKLMKTILKSIKRGGICFLLLASILSFGGVHAFNIIARPNSYAIHDEFKGLDTTRLDAHIPRNTEDFTGFNETDGPGKVTVAANTITLTDGDRDEDYYVTKDFGAGYFGDFTHWVDVNVTAITADGNSSFYFDAISNADDDLFDIDAANGDCIFLGVGRIGAGYRVGIYNVDGGALTISTGGTTNTLGNPVYISSSRAGTVLTAEVYSTAALRIAGGAGDVDTITHTVVATAFQFVYGLASYNNAGTAKNISGTVSNLWLGTSGNPELATPWISATGTIQGNEAVMAETLETPEIDDDGASDRTGDWTEVDCTAAFDTDHYEITYVADTQQFYRRITVLEVGKLFRFSAKIQDGTSAGVTVTLRGGSNPTAILFTTKATTVSWATISAYFIAGVSYQDFNIFSTMVGAGNYELKDILLEEVTQSSILALSDFGFSGGRFKATFGTVLPGELAGIVILANDSTASTDGVFGVIDRSTGKLHVWKGVSGTDTTLINESVTYNDGDTLWLVFDRAEQKIWAFFDNVIVGTPQALTDESIIDNSYHGLLLAGGATMNEIDFKEIGYDAPLTTSGDDITKANPGVVTVAGHPLSNGDLIYFSGLTQMTELNQQYDIVANDAANTFSIRDTSGFGSAETTGGAVVQKVR